MKYNYVIFQILINLIGFQGVYTVDSL